MVGGDNDQNHRQPAAASIPPACLRDFHYGALVSGLLSEHILRTVCEMVDGDGDDQHHQTSSSTSTTSMIAMPSRFSLRGFGVRSAFQTGTQESVRWWVAMMAPTITNQQHHQHHNHAGHALEPFTTELRFQGFFPNKYPGKCLRWWAMMVTTIITNQQQHQHRQHDGHALEIFTTELWCQDCFPNRYPGKCVRWWVVMLIANISNQQAPAPPAWWQCR